MKLFARFQSKGFTLIELLIVIALIGALAVGLLAALDPIEQINRGRDSGSQSMATEYIKAQERYFANNAAYAGADIVATATLLSTLGDAGEDMPLLVTAGELKDQYRVSAISANGAGPRISILNKVSASGLFEVAMQVYSKSFKINPQLNRCTTISGACTACTAASATCYVRINY